MATLLDRITWGRCRCCGGQLPLVDDNNDSPELPDAESGGDCPGHVTPDGHCGAYTDDEIWGWFNAAKRDAERESR